MIVDILIISNIDDYSTDMICRYLYQKNVNYLRINRYNLKDYNISWDINAKVFKIKIAQQKFIINSTLKVVYYRAPTFLRESFYKSCTYNEQISLSQWMAFVRNLMFFDKAFWMNSPKDIYFSENKLLQLKIAKEVGLKIPKTYVVNGSDNLSDDVLYAVKSIDTSLFGNSKHSYFTYTKLMKGAQIKKFKLNNAPICIQEAITNKIDLRVTYICGHMYTAKIYCPDVAIEGDWRLNKDCLRYERYVLPKDIKIKINKLMKSLHLSYGGIDLMYREGEYYFVEVNPTGEWAWLSAPCKFELDKKIGNILIKHKNEKIM